MFIKNTPVTEGATDPLLSSLRRDDNLVIINQVCDDARADIKQQTTLKDCRRTALRLADYLFDIIDDYERGLRSEAMDKINHYEKIMWGE